MLLSEKRCHYQFTRLFTEPDREEVHSQTIQVMFKPQFENLGPALLIWGGVPVNRTRCLCIEKDSQYTYLII